MTELEKATSSDLERVKAPFLVFVLESTLTTFDHKNFPDVKKCVDASIDLWKRDDLGSVRWIEVAGEVEAAAKKEYEVWVRAAAKEEWAAVYAAAVFTSLFAVKGAVAEAVWAAAWASEESAATKAPARVAAWMIGEEAKASSYEKFADKLIELIKETK